MTESSIVDFLASVEFFSPFIYRELEQLAGHAESLHFEFGDTICTSGDTAQGLFVIKAGRVRLFTEDRGKERSIGVREPGDTFGEVSVLEKPTLDYSARASSKVEILFFPRQPVMDLLVKNEAAQGFIARYVALKVSGAVVTQLFNLRSKVDRGEIEEIIQGIGIKRVKAGEHILVQEGAEDRRLYIVREGKVSIVKEEEGSEYSLMSLGPGEVFGEKACLLYSTQPATAVADTDSVLMVVPQETIHFILERNPGLREVLEERIHFAEKELERRRKVAERRKKRLLFDIKSKPKMGERIIKRFPLVEQAEEMDCGAACLAMICKYYDIPVTLGKLREMANVTIEGATMESLARVGESLGFATKGVRCTYKSMLSFELPFVAHWEGYHYIVVYGISKSHVWAADPGVGFRKMSVSEFEQGWTGNNLLFSPTGALAQIAVEQSPWLRFVGYLSPFKKILRDLIFASLIVQLLGLAPPVIIQNILDRVVVHQNYHLLPCHDRGSGNHDDI